MTSHQPDGVNTTADNGRHISGEPQERPHYTLADLLAQCDRRAELNNDDDEWLSAPPVGRELM